jgi:hypothetical protein
METHYDRLANCAGYHLDDEVWFYHWTHVKGKSPSSNPHGRAHTR